MTKLIIQIPCYNEERTLPETLSNLPREVAGVDDVEWLVVDDGSSDESIAAAVSGGVDHVVRLPRHQGLARAFIAGLDGSIRAGADIIVNTDADNQYNPDDISKLVEPIMSGRADIVIGARPIETIEDFSLLKKLLQRFGSWVTRQVSKTDVQDAPSGFRAMSREAAMRLHVFTEYTYTIETVIQAGQKGMAIVSVPIRTNRTTRPSRLVRSLGHYVVRQMVTVIRIFVTYRPFRFFASLGAISFLTGLAISARFLYFFLSGRGVGHVQSLILSALLMSIGVALVFVGLLADLIAVNRKLLEDVEWRLYRVEERFDDARSEHPNARRG